MSSLVLDKSGLDKIVARFNDPTIKMELERIPQRKAVAAIVAQAIADNFDKEGPGWAPLKAATIQASVSKKIKKSIADMSDAELEKYEQKARKQGSPEAFAGPNRRILQKTRLLRGTVTTPGVTLSKNGITGSNIWKTEGTKLIWGTDLVYAAVHNKGNPAKGIPQRKFLTIRQEWMKQLQDYIIKEAFKIIVEKVVKGGGT